MDKHVGGIMFYKHISSFHLLGAILDPDQIGPFIRVFRERLSRYVRVNIPIVFSLLCKPRLLILSSDVNKGIFRIIDSN